IGSAAQRRHALALEAHTLAGLRAFGNGHTHAAAIDGRHLDLAAEGGIAHGDRRAGKQRLAVALEDVVLFYRDEDVEIALGAAARAGLAFIGKADALAIL